MNNTPTRLIELHRQNSSESCRSDCPEASLLLAAALGEQGAHLAPARHSLAHCSVCAAAAQRALAIHRSMETLDAPGRERAPERRGGWSLGLAACAGIMALALFITGGTPSQNHGVDLDAALAGGENGQSQHDDGALFRSTFNDPRPDDIFSHSMM